MGLVAVKDPSVLAKLEGGKPVSDPTLLAQLEEADVGGNLAKIDSDAKASEVKEPETFAYLFNRLKKGVAGFMGIPGDVLQLLKPTAGTQASLANNPNLAMSDAQRAFHARRSFEMAAEGPPQTATERFVDKPIATSADYSDAMGYAPGMKTGSTLKRYAGGVVEMAGSGGPFALAAKPATIVPLVTGTIGSGIGMEAGGDIASGMGLSRDAGEGAGALVGGMSSAVAPNAAMTVGGAIKRRFSPTAQKASAESAAGRQIAGQLEAYPHAQANIQRSLEVSDQIPGFNPTLPARSGAPGLLAEEKVIVSRDATAHNKFAARIKENDEAVRAFVSDKFKPGTVDAATQVRKLSQQHATRLEAIRKQIDDKLDDAVRVFETNPANFENGERLRDLFFKQKQVYAGIRSQKYQDVYQAAETAGLKANVDDAVDYVADVLTNKMNAYQQSEIPSVFRELAKKGGKGVPDDVNAFVAKNMPKPETPDQVAAHLAALKTPAGKPPPPKDISFAELHSLYKRTNADLASLRGSNRVDKDFQIHLLEGLKTKLTDKIRAFEGPEFGDVAAKLKEANRFYAEEYVPRFKQGFGSDVAARLPSGEFRTISDHIVDLIARPKNVRGAKDFKMLFDEVPEAWDALRAGYMDKFFKTGSAIDKNGRINQKSLESFLRVHDDTLTQFPEVKKELQRLALDNGGLLERRAAIVAAEKRLAASELYKLFQGKDPNVVLTEALSNPNAMRVLAFQARHNPEMAKALGRGVAEQVTMQADPASFLQANEKAIRVALKPLGDEHFKNLQTAVEALTINARNPAVQSVAAASVTPDRLAAGIGSSPRALMAAGMSVARGRTGVHQEAAFILGRWFDQLRRDHKAVAMEAVFYDKDTARALANLAKNPQSDKAKLDFVTQMTALGVRAEVAGQE